MSDFDGDGTQDLAIVNSTSNTFSFLAGNGDGTFRDRVDTHAGTAPYSVAVGDFNSDGFPDLAIAVAATNSVLVFPGNGDGTFSDPVEFPVGTEPHFVVTGDFNGDGQPDLAIANWNSELISILYNNTF